MQCLLAREFSQFKIVYTAVSIIFFDEKKSSLARDLLNEQISNQTSAFPNNNSLFPL